MGTCAISDPPQHGLADLNRELMPAVLERCRELVEEYLKAPEAFPFSEEELLRWYWETKAHFTGGDACAFCGVHVPTPVPVRVEVDADNVLLFPCLCKRCLKAQKASAQCVSFDYMRDWMKPTTEPQRSSRQTRTA